MRRTAVGGVALVALVVLGACSSGKTQGTEPLRAAPTTTTTAVAVAVGDPSPSTTSAPATTKPPARPTATTTPPARSVNGVPQVTASPSAARPGTRVHIEGDGFGEATWRQPEPLLWLAARQGPCALMAETSHTVRVSDVGHLSGDFTVPSMGVCRQGDNVDVLLPAGRYAIAYQCTACFIGEIEVIAPAEPVTARCNDIGFAPNSDNLASDIVATNMTCAEADALIRKVGGPLGPINGPERAEADGFTCIRVSQSDSRLPTATYECTNGAQKVVFVR